MFRKIRATIRSWLTNFLHGSYHHYLCYLPRKIGTFPFYALKLFYSGIKLDETQISTLKKVEKGAIIVYVTRNKSLFEYLFYFVRYQLLKMPFPQIGFDYRVVLWQPVSRLLKVMLAHIDYFLSFGQGLNPYEGNYFREEILNGRAALLSLIEKRGFYRRFVKSHTDPIQFLIKMQQTIDRPILLVPQLMFFSRKPQRAIPTIADVLFGSETSPGFTRRLIALFKNPGKVFVEISEPLDLKKFVTSPENAGRTVEHQALLLRRNLLLQINRHRQVITGPLLKSRIEMKENILTNETLQRFMKHYSEKRGVALQEVQKEAEAYIEEIAAAYSPAIIKIGAVLISWITNTMFEGVSVNREEINRLKSLYQKGPLILIPCHKSHIDYLILSYVMYINNMLCPHVAAGKNLSFWPVGPFFRGGGAFFIRRTFRGAVLYSKVFAEYIKKLLEEGFNIELFIEGGRSRTGKLIMPKLGLLSILLDAYRNGACRDMVFVPIYIGYDRVLEEGSYINEIEGGQKKPESFAQVLKARKFLKTRYGRIYIKFHEPISLKERLEQGKSSISELSQKELNTLCRYLGFKIINAIDRVTVVTPHALTATAILNCSRKRISHEHFMSHIEALLKHLIAHQALLTDTLHMDPIRAVEQVLENYVQQKFVDRIEPDQQSTSQEPVYTVPDNKRPLLEYYKNNCIAFFVPAAFTALAIIAREAFQFSAADLYDDYHFLRDFFQNEFAYDVDHPPEYIIRKTIKAFIDDAVLTPHPTLPDTYNVTSAGLNTLKFFAHFLKTYLESYWVVLTYFKRYPANANSPRERLKRIQSRGLRMFKNEELTLKEALSKVNYENAINYFIAHDVKGSACTPRIEHYDRYIRRFLRHLSF